MVEVNLKRLQDAGALQPVNYSHWATPIIVVKKPNGTIRLCADFSTGLNASPENHEYPLLLPDGIFTRMNSGRFFAQLDLSDTHLQAEVSEESRQLLTINTHRGLYQYVRLLIGVKTAPTIFQQIMDTMLCEIEEAAAYLDDIIVVSPTRKELSLRLENELNRIRD